MPSESDPKEQASVPVDQGRPENEPQRRWATEAIDQPWTIGEAIGVAMRALRGHFASLFVPCLVVLLAVLAISAGFNFWLGVFQTVGSLLRGRTASSDPFGGPPPIAPWLLPVGGGFAAVVGLLGGALSTSFLVEAALAAVRDEAIKPGRVGRAFKRALPILGWNLLPIVAILLIAGLVEVVLPIGIRFAEAEGPAPFMERCLEGLQIQLPWYVHLAVLLAALVISVGYVLTFFWAPFFLVDEQCSLVTAMRKSWRASRQHVGTIFVYVLALAPVALLTLLPIVGLVAAAFVLLGFAYGYVRATGRNDLPWYTPEFASRSIRTLLRITLGVLTFISGGLILIVKLSPRTSAWSIWDTVLHAVAIVTLVAAVAVFLALLLPYFLDRLEGRRFTSFVAARHVRSQKSGFLTVISVLSICGVALSSCALSSVVSVMGGFSEDLKRKILGNSAHIVIDTTAGTPWGEYEQTLDAVRKVPGVVGATPVVHGEVMASSASNLAGVVVTGIDPSSINDVVELQHNIVVGKLDYLEHPEKLTKLPPTEVIGLGPNGENYYKGTELPALNDDLDPEVRAVLITKPDRPGVILGLELAKTLHVYVGDEVTLVSPLGDLGPMGVMPRTKRFRVAAIFDSGMYEYDAMSVYTMLAEAQEYFATGDNISAIDIKVDDAENTERITPAVVAAVNRPELRIRDWREINKNLFSALKLERFATFIILSIAIMVASFCIICTLLLMVTEKGKEIAILKAIGATDGAVLRTFMIEGVIIGGIGMVFGVVTGFALCSGLKWIGLPLPSEVYYIHGLPVSVNGFDFLKVAAAALLITTVSTIYPAYAASRLRPVDGLRYE
jgi:lipoprotein-releasing system permease protein